MVANNPQIQCALNFFVNVTLIWFPGHQIFELSTFSDDLLAICLCVRCCDFVIKITLPELYVS